MLIDKAGKEIQRIVQHCGYDEYIAFALDWYNLQPTDIELKRLSNGSFEQLDTINFVSSDVYSVWWKPPYVSYRGYQTVNNNFLTVTNALSSSDFNSHSFFLNTNYQLLEFYGVTGEGDEIQLFTGASSWDISNIIGDPFELEYNYFGKVIYSRVWFPITTQIMHFCWRTFSNGIPLNYERVNYQNGSDYTINILSVTSTQILKPRIIK